MLVWSLWSRRVKILNKFLIFLFPDPADQTRSTVASISESVCRPLKTRIEQMIVIDQGREGGKKPVQLYKISNLLRFYHNTILQVRNVTFHWAFFIFFFFFFGGGGWLIHNYCFKVHYPLIVSKHLLNLKQNQLRTSGFCHSLSGEVPFSFNQLFHNLPFAHY